MRSIILDWYSTEWHNFKPYIRFPRLYERSQWLYDQAWEWLKFWHNVYEEKGWNFPWLEAWFD